MHIQIYSAVRETEWEINKTMTRGCCGEVGGVAGVAVGSTVCWQLLGDAGLSCLMQRSFDCHRRGWLQQMYMLRIARSQRKLVGCTVGSASFAAPQAKKARRCS